MVHVYQAMDQLSSLGTTVAISALVLTMVGDYLFLQLFPVTILFVVIAVFHFCATAAPVNLFLLQAQTAATLYQFYPVVSAYSFGEASNYYIHFLIVYGFWNLDFF